jgi:hypothetical protein
VETRLKGYKYFEIERDFFNKLGVLIDGDFKFGVLLLVFVRFRYIDTFKHKTDKYSNQNKLFSVHFQEMPGFKGKRKRGLTLTLYKNPFRYRLPVSPPRKRTKASSSTPNLKSSSIRTPSLIKKNLFQFQNLYILSNGFPHLFDATGLLKMTETSPQIYTSYILHDFSTYIGLT